MRNVTKAFRGLVYTAVLIGFTGIGAVVMAGETYSAILMSDTHYDKKKYDTNTVLPDFWKEEATRNYKMWDNGKLSMSYALLKNAAKVKDDSTAFILHSGDMIQGDFDSPESTAAATRDAIRDITSIVGLPIYMTMDNHDASRYPVYPKAITDCAPGWEARAKHEQAFLEVMKNYQKNNLEYERLGDPLNMTKLYNGDLYIFVRGNPNDDSNDKVNGGSGRAPIGMQYLAEELAKYPKESVRHTFVIVHLPVILGKNYGKSKPWHVDCFVGCSPELRSKIIADLAAREAIVFNGHKHYWEKIDAKFPQGTIHQLMTNANNVDYKKKWNPCDNFAEFAASTAAEGKGSTLDDGGAEAITDYILFSDRGFVKLLISDEGVTAECYSGAMNGKLLRTIKVK